MTQIVVDDAWQAAAGSVHQVEHGTTLVVQRIFLWNRSLGNVLGVIGVALFGILDIGLGASAGDDLVALAWPWCAWYADYLNSARLRNALGCMHWC